MVWGVAGAQTRNLHSGFPCKHMVASATVLLKASSNMSHNGWLKLPDRDFPQNISLWPPPVAWASTEHGHLIT